MKNILLTVLVVISLLLKAQEPSQPGLIESYTNNAVVLTKTGQHIDFATDGNINTYWESDAPLPTGYIKLAGLNAFLNGSQNNLLDGESKAFDGNTDTFEPMHNLLKNANRKGVEIPFAQTSLIYLVSVKLNCTRPVSIALYNNQDKKAEFTVLPEQNYQLLNFQIVELQLFDKVVISSSESFQLFELAALNTRPYVTFTLDLQENLPIGQIYSRHLNSDQVTDVDVLVSDKPDHWQKLASLNPQSVPMLPTVLKQQVKARFLQLRFYLKMQDYAKAALWELAVYDDYGPFGKPVARLNNKSPLNERIGLNAVWGWGFNVYSDEITGGYGPKKFVNVFKKIRLYHNLLWDIKAPGLPANYELMEQGKGTDANWWLNWTREYRFLQNLGFDVSTALLFKNRTVPISVWANPEKDAYQIGNEFASFFGKTKGNDLIESFELGNEPWDYPPEFFRTVSASMLKGVRDADNSLFTLPAAFQATFPPRAFSETNDYITDYISTDQLLQFDALNAHFYAHTFSENGSRISVPPEDKRAGTNGIINLVNFRNSVAPNAQIWITEFGYDSEGAGESCLHSECVSEAQQAAWGLRAAILLLRYGADRAYWYFYANEDNAEGLHSRSGLLSSSIHGFQEKQSFRAFKQLMENAGHLVLSEVLLEYQDVFCYKLLDPQSLKSYALMWYAGAIDPDETVLIKTRILPTNKRKYVIDGSSSNSWVSFDENSEGLLINGYPTLFEIE